MIEINVSILLAQIVTFVIALYVIWKIAWKPLTGMMSLREEKIRGDIEAARLERQASEDLKKAYEQHLSKSRAEADAIIARAVSDGQHERENIVNLARAEAAKLTENTKRELAQEKQKLSKELRAEVAGIAVEIAEKLVKRSIDKSVQDEVVRQAMDNIGKE